MEYFFLDFDQTLDVQPCWSFGHLLRLSFRFLDQKLYDAVGATDLLTIEDFIVSKMKLATCG